jgi:hypothetical protein
MLQPRRTAVSLLLFPLLAACSNDDSNQSPGSQSEGLTYWDDMAPLFAEHCTSCHQDGGIAPFALDDYASAKEHAAKIRAETLARAMPPWSATSDGSCQNFSGSLALTDSQIADIGSWVNAGAPEGTKKSVAQPTIAELDDGSVFTTPRFLPEPQGGALAEHDEYRCFLMDSGVSEPSFITAYEVTPGATEIVHHALLMIVDPDVPAGNPNDPQAAALGTNLEHMQALDDESPDRLGWPCFGTAGDDVNVSSVPVVWAPGQGVVEYPAKSGVPIRPKDKVVVQIHYNLADQQGLEDETRIKLRITNEVENVAFFGLPDPFLNSAFEDEPDTLPPGKASTKYHWQLNAEQLGFSELPQATLRGVMPHMHQLGRKFRMNIVTGSQEQCGVDVQDWDFHWQRMYFYEKPIALSPDSAIAVTCDYDTSSKQTAVLPGWGTQNEMCLATLFVTVPAAALR